MKSTYVLLMLCLGWVVAVGAAEAAVLSREQLAASHEEIESSVKTGHGIVEYRTIYVPETESNSIRVELIEWWRDGRRERIDWLQFDSSEKYETRNDRLATTSKAFDGHIIRTLQHLPTEPRGSQGTISSTARDKSHRNYPFGLLVEYQMSSYSTIIRNGGDFRCRVIQVDGEEWTEAYVTHPEQINLAFTFRYDAKMRLRERVLHHRWLSEPPEALMEREHYKFSDYRPARSDDGDAILFPLKVSIDYYRRPDSGGEPELFQTELVQTHEITFNMPVDEERFSITFEPGTQVYDDVFGKGWIAWQE